jgi:diguanylate cyclase (GGDEF)-like protein
MRVAILAADAAVARRLEGDLAALGRARPKYFTETAPLLEWVAAQRPALVVVTVHAGDAGLSALRELSRRLARAAEDTAEPGTAPTPPALLALLPEGAAHTAAAALSAGAVEVCRCDAHPAELRNRIALLLDLAEARAAVQAERDTRGHAAIADPLTGLMNRKAFLGRLEAEIARTRRGGRPMVLALVDVDRLKHINSAHGHTQGDRVLCAVADQMRAMLRGMDLAGRLGGTEFAICLPEVPLAEGAAVLERLRRRLADLAFPLGGGPERRLTVTVSIGVTELAPEDADASDLINRADRALLAAKDAGGGCLARE